jgi:hypothetical protein
MPGKTRVKQQLSWPLFREMAVPDFLETFEK